MTLFLYAIVLFGYATLFFGLHTQSRRAISATLLSLCLFLGLVLSTFETPTPLFLTAFGPVAVSLILWLIWILTHRQVSPLSLPTHALALRMIALWYVAETFSLMDLSVPPDDPALAALYHPFAPLHIWTAILARSTLLLVLCHAAFSHAIPKHALTLSLVLQAVALFSGILWAQDTWLVGWHWDPIETLSLITLMATAAICRTRTPASLCAATIALVGTLCITNGTFSNASRHSYGIDQPLLFAFHAAFLITLLYHYIYAPRVSWGGGSLPLRGYAYPCKDVPKNITSWVSIRRYPLCGATPRNAPDTRSTSIFQPYHHTFDKLLLYISSTLTFLFITITLCIIFGFLTNTTKFNYLFNLIFIILAFIHHKNKLNCISSILLCVLIWIHPFTKTTSTEHFITPLIVQTPAGSATLLDLDRTTPIARAVIRLDSTPKTLTFFEEEHQSHTRTFYLNNNRLWRVSANAYTPAVGLSVRITDVTFFGIWLFLVMICSCIMLQRSLAATRPLLANLPKEPPDMLS